MVDRERSPLLVRRQSGKSIDRGSAVTPLELVQRTERLSSETLWATVGDRLVAYAPFGTPTRCQSYACPVCVHGRVWVCCCSLP